MDAERLRTLLERLARGELSVPNALERIRVAPFENLGFACIDHHRHIRCGFPEVVLGLGKTSEQVVEISRAIVERGNDLLVTRVSEDQAGQLAEALPRATHHRDARCVTLRVSELEPVGCVAVVCAGTADIPVAQEAAVTAGMLGARIERFFDVGVAGLHRVLVHMEALSNANAIVVAAGMEGALASVVGGLVDVPIVAVPTSIGYGASMGGLSALLTMLNSCAAGVSVVNIDNGFSAGYQVALINRAIEAARENRESSQEPSP